MVSVHDVDEKARVVQILVGHTVLHFQEVDGKTVCLPRRTSLHSRVERLGRLRVTDLEYVEAKRMACAVLEDRSKRSQGQLSQLSLDFTTLEGA